MLLSTSLSSWKKGFRTNLAPYLRLEGKNEIQIRVYGEEGPPALLVEGPKEVRSDNRWKIALGPEFSEFSDVAVALNSETYMGKNWMATHVIYPFSILVISGFVFYCLFIVYALIPMKFKPWLQTSWMRNSYNEQRGPDGDHHAMPLSRSSTFWRQHGFFLILMAVVTVVQFHNVMN